MEIPFHKRYHLTIARRVVRRARDSLAVTLAFTLVFDKEQIGPRRVMLPALEGWLLSRTL